MRFFQFLSTFLICGALLAMPEGQSYASRVAALAKNTGAQTMQNMHNVYTGQPQMYSPYNAGGNNFNAGASSPYNANNGFAGMTPQLMNMANNFGGIGNLMGGNNGLTSISQHLFQAANILQSLQNILFVVQNLKNLFSNIGSMFSGSANSGSMFAGMPQGQMGIPNGGMQNFSPYNANNGFMAGSVGINGNVPANSFSAALSNKALATYQGDDAPSGMCARGVANFIEGMGVSAPRGMDAWQTENWFASNPQWKMVPISHPSQAPIGSVLTYNRNQDWYNYGGGGAKFGHVEVVSQSSNGSKLFVSGGASSVPGGTVPSNFNGHAWVFVG